MNIVQRKPVVKTESINEFIARGGKILRIQPRVRRTRKVSPRLKQLTEKEAA